MNTQSCQSTSDAGPRSLKLFSHRLRLTARATSVAILLSSAAFTEAAIALKQVAEGFTSPLALVPFEDGSGRLLVADQVGTVHVLSKEGQIQDKLFLDLRDRLAKLNEGFDERGLLGLVLHPKFQRNHRLFVCYSAPLRKDAPDENV